jgi:ESS family glutamate:Na+ symporter
MFEIDTYGTLVAASLVLILGRKLVQWFPLFKTYTIPETIVGGLFASIIVLCLKSFGNIELHFDTSVRDPLMLAFFATVGLNANLMKLKKGGKVLVVFLLAVLGLLLLQNIVGISLAMLLGVDPLMGLLGGSITMHGGHATGAAWADIFSTSYGFSNAAEVAMACATFGLVLGGLLGGPVGSYLIKRTKLSSNVDDGQDEGFEKPSKERLITSLAIIEAIAMIAISLSIGSFITALLKGTPFELPSFVCVLFVGVVLSNTLSALGVYTVFERAMSVLGNVSLSLFLAIALMSLKLWELTSLAVPMLVILTVQTVMMALYAVFVTYRVMGKSYDAVVLTAGHCGFGLGATPTAIANMQAITDKYGPSHVAFLVVPMTAAFFLDLVNAVAIKLFLLLPIFPPPPI